MHFFHSVPHHRRDDNDEHDLVYLLMEIALVALIIFLWPSG